MAVDPARYWHAPADKRLTRYYWNDPEPTVAGMLAADRIRAYDQLVGGMIRPFQDNRLKPASYELTLGPKCLLEGKDRILSDADPYLEVPPNSIVFVSTREALLLPHWLSARFDLAVEFLYKGLLVGTGPQVDPGFQGVLSCPLHNISSGPVVLTFREPFLKIDFTKTTGLDAGVVGDVGTEDELYRRALSPDGNGVVLWKRGGQFREPIHFAPASRHAKSSLREMDEFAQQARRWSLVLVLGYLTALVVVFSALIAGGAWITNHISGRIDTIERRSDRLPELREALNASRAEQRRLRVTLEQIERDLVAPATGAP